MDGHESDAENIEQARLGSLDAFDALVMQHQDGLRVFLSVRAGNLDQAEEILQATFVSAWKGLAGFRREASFPSWLRGIAVNLLRHDFRDRRRTMPMEGDILDRLVDGECERRLSVEPDGDQDQLTQLRRCLSALPTDQRTLLLDHHGSGRPLEMLSAQLGRTRPALAKLLFTLRGALRRCIERGQTVSS